jgi:hypothetical protein
MIRIDEIYQNTFWPWFDKNLPGNRIQFCDPFGRSDPDSILNYGWDDIPEYNYTFFFDQEPVNLNIHLPTFDQIKNHHNKDIHYNTERCSDFVGYNRAQVGNIVTSERDSSAVDFLCKKYNWRSYYYFFHGWAALDWYRGYDKTFLIKPWTQRTPTKTFIAPNRIVAGERQHRLEMLYHIFKNNMQHNHISCPAVCPAENISIEAAATPLLAKYPDIQQVFAAQNLPINFENETDHPMHSCWLSLFDECADSLLYLVTETVASGRRHHLTEKTFKPIAMGMPFVIVGTRGSLQYLRSYGFRTFEGIWDESYDDAEDGDRIARIASLLRSLDELTPAGRQDLFEMALPVIEHNWNHFYGGGFEAILWKELSDMLETIRVESSL